ncbi:ImmA/IrrE family metallo-endopeptidase [bacterium]|nr:ImmA/IrrE family metallo-endopeptidase [bacterium]
MTAAWTASKPANESRARTVALGFLRAEHIKDITLEDLDELMRSQNIIVRYRPLTNAASQIVQKGAAAFVTVDSGITSQGRRRFCVVHEFGHFMLGHVATAMRCTEEKFHTWYRTNGQEIEANAFASEFLMPEDLYKAAIAGRPPKREVLNNLADKFGVSMTAACVRYAEVGSHPCVLFVSRAGEVLWYRASQDAVGKHLRRGDKVSSWSAAGQYYADGEMDESDDLVDYHAWFVDDDEGQRIHETPIFMPAVNTVLSMVWFE